MKRTHGLPAAGALVAMLVLATAAGAVVGGSKGTADGSSAVPGIDTGSAIVELKGDPLSTYVKTKPPHGKKIDFSSSAVKSYRAQLSALRNDFKQWLHANTPSAKVSGEYDIALNAVAVRLNGTPLSKLASAPMVQKAQYEGVYRPAAADPDLPLVHAPDAWALGGGPANAGTGVRVGIIDTGIDVTHPCFGDAGYSAQVQLGDHTLTNNKVVVARVFNNQSPRFGYTAAPVQEHGTHVAGTVACNFGTSASVNGVAIGYAISGVAPRALLGNYNVFPGNDDNARSEDILNALEAAYRDGMDIVNMSLGGKAQGFQDLLTDAVDDLDQAGMVSAVAAGNSGPGHFTVESPGSAARALTAGAMTVGHFVAAIVAAAGGPFNVATGDFATASTDLTAPLAPVLSGGELSTVCSAISDDLTGKIAVVSRGTCTFSTKIRNAQSAGAVAALVVNNVNGDPTSMGQDGTPGQPTIPAYMAGLADKAALLAAGGSSATISAALAYVQTANSNFMAGFSSQGPTDVDFRVKPDVASPGVNVLSSIPAAFCAAPPCFAFFQGTSMATPHLAGTAAVVKWLHPGWDAGQIRSAIVNTADEGVLKKFRGAGLETDVNVVGAGRDDALAAAGAQVALDPVSVSFGAVPAGSGQTRSAKVALSSLGGSATGVTIDAGGDGVGYSASLSGGVITITMNAAKGAVPGGHQATLRVWDGGTEVAHAVVYTLIK